jgi:outer membrane protein TolC
MKLVSIHKHKIILILSLLSITSAQAQVWTLQQCIDTAQLNNKTLQINRNNIALAEQRHKEAKANLIPKVTANTDYKYFTNLPYQLMPLSTFNPAAPEGEFREAQFGVPHHINANLQLSMPLYNPNIYGAIQNTKIATEIAELQSQKTEEQVFFEISNLYYNAQILHSQKEFAERNIQNSELLLSNIQLLNEQLLATKNDVNKIRLQIAQLTTQKENLESKLKQVLNGLKHMMGLAPEYSLIVETDIQYEERWNHSGTTTFDLLIIQKQNTLLLSELSTLNKSRFLPAVNLFANYGTTGFGYDKQPNSFLNFYPIGFAGLQVSYPLFNGTITQRKINQKNIELQNNELQYSLMSEQTAMQIKNTILQLNAAKSSVETILQQIELAQLVYAQTVLQQKQGVANLTDVLLADNALREAQQSYHGAVVDYLKADLELKKLTNQLSTKN